MERDRSIRCSVEAPLHHMHCATYLLWRRDQTSVNTYDVLSDTLLF